MENSEGESEITANSLPFLRGFCWALKPRTEHWFEHWHSCSMMFSFCLFNKSWQWLYSTCFTQFEASRGNCIGLVRFCSILFDFVRLYWFENRTHSKIGVRFCSIAEPNRTIGVRLGSIGFLFGFVRLDRSGSLFVNLQLQNIARERDELTKKALQAILSLQFSVSVYRTSHSSEDERATRILWELTLKPEWFWKLHSPLLSWIHLIDVHQNAESIKTIVNEKIKVSSSGSGSRCVV